mmetsp:Transcript_34400/g.77727  ORF Transcript_34400/g.77727 Transcript_34400/m.77727 type:complete len:156 (+) Transcript_34400:583-1050(+)
MARLELTGRQANAKSEATGASTVGGTSVSSLWFTDAGGGQADFAGMVASLAESASWATSRTPMKVAGRTLQEALQESQTEVAGMMVNPLSLATRWAQTRPTTGTRAASRWRGTAGASGRASTYGRAAPSSPIRPRHSGSAFQTPVSTSHGRYPLA